jgi:hypothetical protein
MENPAVEIVAAPKSFILLEAHTDVNDPTKTAEIIVRMDFIKSVSRVEKDSEIIHRITPIIGSCGIELLDGRTLMVKHTFEEISAILGAYRVSKVH